MVLCMQSVTQSQLPALFCALEVFCKLLLLLKIMRRRLVVMITKTQASPVHAAVNAPAPEVGQTSRAQHSIPMRPVHLHRKQQPH